MSASIDRVAAEFGRSPVGVTGRVSWTWEKAIPDLPYVLVFELVTWTKAGEVIAIDAFVGETGTIANEVPLF